MIRTPAEQAAWMQGFSCALITANALNDVPIVCKNVLLSTGKSLDDFQSAGCDEHTMKELKRIWRNG